MLWRGKTTACRKCACRKCVWLIGGCSLQLTNKVVADYSPPAPSCLLSLKPSRAGTVPDLQLVGICTVQRSSEDSSVDVPMKSKFRQLCVSLRSCMRRPCWLSSFKFRFFPDAYPKKKKKGTKLNSLQRHQQSPKGTDSIMGSDETFLAPTSETSQCLTFGMVGLTTSVEAVFLRSSHLAPFPCKQHHRHCTHSGMLL